MFNKKKLVFFMLLIIALTGVIVSYFAGHARLQGLLINSDSLFLPTLFHDIFVKGGNINDWYLSPAPYFFPDDLLFLFAYLFGSNPYSQITIFCITQIVLTFFAIWLLANQNAKSGRFVCSVTIVIALILMGLNYGPPFYFMFVSVFHYGVFLSALFFVALWMQYESSVTRKELSNPWLLGLISIIAFLATLSDQLFIVQVIVPFIATVILVDLASRDFSIKRTALSLIPFLFSILGSLSYIIIVAHHKRYPISLGFKKVPTNLLNFYTMSEHVITENPVYEVTFIVYLGLIIYSFYKLIRWSKYTGYQKPLIWLILFSFFSLCSNILAVVLSTKLSPVLRHFIPAFFWPCIVVTFFLSNFLRQKFFAVGIVISCLAVAQMSFSTYELVVSQGLSTQYYPSEIACIDNALARAHVTNGIAGYWDAKHLQNLSRLDLNIAQYTDFIEERDWITSEKYFKKHYDFAVSSQKHELKKGLSHLKEVPENVVTCGTKSVYIYGKNKLRVRKIIDIGDFYQWKACELPTGGGGKIEQCQVINKNLTRPGCLTFGPYVALPSGQYSFEIIYSSMEKNQGIIGHWDVTLAGRGIIEKGHLTSPNDSVAKITRKFTVEPEYNMKKVEVRTFANKNRALKIIAIQITRLA